MKIVNKLMLATFSLVFVFASCESLEVNSDNSDEPGTMRVFLTDAPADYESVVIDIREIRIHKNEDAVMEEDSDSDGDNDGEDQESDGEWIIISDEPQKVDLLQLTNGITEFLGETELEAGTYSQMRLILGDENEITVDGATKKLTTPSAQQSGLKLNIHAEVESNAVYTLLLDFDASRSIVKAGNSGKYLLKPVIKTVDLARTGAIAGTVEPADAMPWVYAIADEDTLAGTRADELGEYLMIGLLSGTYDVAVFPDTTVYDQIRVEGIEVSAPDTTVVDTLSLQEVQ
ncbi:DUF4382 domain-containing protein [Rhodohalobacter mucosus]|uniref:DUF4382 domain-containing protein n=1 Tax=Rhodohalobacter mucosus TaxID=2079485 RepID=A0A316TZS3_9BACT|nr:DUF4382 domain-containing protein [Rhodohalobacter mucosus]PWN05716.1 hypothetical protein DDZ15_14115 [Rhodohalobacter mucosus]